MRTRNLVNHKRLDTWLSKIVEDRAPHIQNWVATHERRWLKDECPTCMRQLLPETLAANPYFATVLTKITDQSHVDVALIVNTRFHTIPDHKLPKWAADKLAQHESLYWFVPASEIRLRIQHWCDFMETLPVREIRHTHAAMEKSVAAWEAELARIKMMQDLVVGTQEIDTQRTLPDSLYMVQLITEGAYKAEGVVMHHCLGSNYWKKKASRIFSIREREVERPRFTIEVYMGPSKQPVGKTPVAHKPLVIQVRGLKNSGPSPTDWEYLYRLFAALDWTYRGDEDDEDEDEEDVEDDDDDEDDEDEDENGDWE